LRGILTLLSLIIVLFPVMHSTSAIVQTAISLVATNNVPPGTMCNAGSGTYTRNPTDNWGVVVVGSIGRTYICTQNIGPSSYAVRITSTLPTPDGTMTTPQSGSAITPGAYALIEFDWAVPASAKPGQVSFIITFRSR
jgi:hypothetical protein